MNEKTIREEAFDVAINDINSLYEYENKLREDKEKITNKMRRISEVLNVNICLNCKYYCSIVCVNCNRYSEHEFEDHIYDVLEKIIKE